MSQLEINIAIVGYGNVGRGVYEAIKRNPDMNLAGIITRRPDAVRAEVTTEPPNLIFDANDLNDSLKEKVDVAILCGGSAKDLPEQGPYFARFFNTVDSYDNHKKISKHFREMDRVAETYGNVAIVSAGWDPGFFSIARVFGNAVLPESKPKGFYGLGEKGGLSMGHSDAIRRIPGVKDARQYTHAIPEAMQRVRNGENPDLKPGDMHWRDCAVVTEPGANQDEIERKIKEMPDYFEPYPRVEVRFVTQEELDKDYSQMPHDGTAIAVGETGAGNKARLEFSCEWESNPEGTASILIPCARAAHRLSRRGETGAYTMLDIPLAYYSPHSREELLKIV